MAKVWNLWHGCHKLSEGCLNCYVYRRDAKYNKDSNQITKNKAFNLPIQKNKGGEYKVKSGELIYTSFTSDFLLEDADEWRGEAWDIIRMRDDCKFLFLTKRIDRLIYNLPDDWGEGWDHVIIGCTCENQTRADERLPIFLNLPIKHRIIICEPILERIDLRKYLSKSIEEVCVGGESGEEARICEYEWILDIRNQCIDKNVSFYFKQTGAKFVMGNRLYQIKRKFQHQQAKKANITFIGENKQNISE